jgi:hypothetical protein
MGQESGEVGSAAILRQRAIQAYFTGYILKLCRNTPDDGHLASVLNGQIAEWESLAKGAYPPLYATDYAALCRATLRIHEERIRSKLDALEPSLRKLDTGNILAGVVR